MSNNFHGPLLALCVLSEEGQILMGSGSSVFEKSNPIVHTTFTVHGIVNVGALFAAFGGRHIVVWSTTQASTFIECSDWVLNVTIVGQYLFAVLMHNRVDVFKNGTFLTTVHAPEEALLYSAHISLEPETGALEVIGGGVLSSVFFWRFKLDSGDISGTVVKHHRGSVFRVRRFVHSELLTTSDDRSVARWAKKNGRWTCSQSYVGHLARVWDAVMHGSIVASACEDGLVRVFNKHTGTLLRALAGHAKDVRVLALSSTTLFSGGEDGNCLGWQIDPTERRTEWKVSECIRGVHLWGQDVIVVTVPGTVLSFKAISETIHEQRDNDEVTVSTIMGNKLFMGFLSGCVNVFDLETKKNTHTIFQLPCRVVSLFPHGAECIAATAKGDIGITGRESWTVSPGSRKLLCHLSLPNGSHLFGDDKGSVSLWDEENTVYKKNIIHDGKIVALNLHTSGTVLASTGCGKCFELKIEEGHFHVIQETRSKYMMSFVASIAGEVVVGFAGPDFVIHDATGVQWRHTCGGHRRPFAWQIDNNYVFVYGHKDTVVRVESDGPICTRIRTGLAGDLVHAMAYDEINQLIVTGCEDGKIRIVDECLDNQISVLESHQGSVRAFCWMGRFLVSGGARSQICWHNMDDTSVRGSMQIRPTNEDVRIMGLASGIDNTLGVVDSAGGVHIGRLKTVLDLEQVSNVPQIVSDRALFLCILGGPVFVAGSSNGFLTVVDPITKSVTDSLRVHENGINAVASVKTGVVVSVSDDQSIAICRILDNNQIRLCVRLPSASSCSLRGVNVRGSRIVTTGTDRRVTEWTLSSDERVLVKLNSHLVSVTDPLAVAILTGGDCVVAGRGIQRLSL